MLALPSVIRCSLAALSIASLLASCNFTPTGAAGNGADGSPDVTPDGRVPPGDSGIDAGGLDTGGLDTGGIASPYTPSNFDDWETLQPVGAITLNCGVSTYDSQTNAFGNWCTQPEPTPETRNGAAVLAMGDFVIASGSSLRLSGDKPVILAVIGDATIAGTLDASAALAVPGPGGSQNCTTGGGGDGLPESNRDNGAGGGGGGGFGTAGGTGGTGGAGGSAGGSIGAELTGTDTLIPLRGGCGGGKGGPNTDGGGGGNGATGGAGGGGVQVSAQGTLEVTGVIAAAGGGGTGATLHDGGGGGGAGGGILLEAVTLTLAMAPAALTANGGGGGEGGSTGSAAPEVSGDNGSLQTDTPAPGGSGGTDSAGDGGAGGAGGSSPENGSDGQLFNSEGGGGGGGGGGVGVIRLNARDACTDSGAVVSPPATGNGTGDCS